MSVILRGDRAIVRMAGPDAARLLHDVLTAPVSPGMAGGRWFALLSPQGKIQAEGLIGATDDAFWLDVASDVADAFFKRMRMYKLRADVTIADLRQSHRVGLLVAGDAPADGLAHADPRGLGTRVIAPVEVAAGWDADDEAVARTRIAHGILELGPDFAADELFPHDIGMDLLGGVDFRKGCYVGQEVVSRMQHRGTARRRPALASGPGVTSLAELSVGGRGIGRLGRAVDGHAVALVRRDKVDDASAVQSAAGPVMLALPPWANYAFEAAAGDAD